MKKLYTFLAIGFASLATLSAQTKLMHDFEEHTIDDPIHAIGWGTMEAIIVDNPLAPGDKVLKFTPNNYNSAPVLAFTLPAGKTLNDATSLDFSGYFAQGDVGWKHIVVEAYTDQPTEAFHRDDNTAARIGSFDKNWGADANWMDYSIPISGSDAMTGTVYIAFGINCGADNGGVTTIWYADDVTLVGADLGTPIKGVLVSETRISSTNGAILINGAEGKKVEIYSLTGAKIFEVASAGSAVSVPVSAGIYVVAIDGVASKVVVK